MAVPQNSKRPAPKVKELTPNQLKAILDFVLASNGKALRALVYR